MGLSRYAWGAQSTTQASFQEIRGLVEFDAENPDSPHELR